MFSGPKRRWGLKVEKVWPKNHFGKQIWESFWHRVSSSALTLASHSALKKKTFTRWSTIVTSSSWTTWIRSRAPAIGRQKLPHGTSTRLIWHMNSLFLDSDRIESHVSGIGQTEEKKEASGNLSGAQFSWKVSSIIQIIFNPVRMEAECKVCKQRRESVNTQITQSFRPFLFNCTFNGTRAVLI